MNNFFKGPFDFDGDGELDPFELGTEFMAFDECTKEEEDEEDFVDWDDDEDDDDDWEKDDWDNEFFPACAKAYIDRGAKL